MQRVEYIVKDNLGIHARPAGILVKTAQKYLSDITVVYGDKKADMRRLFALMSLCVKPGDKIIVEINGDDEIAAAEDLKNVLISSL